MMIRRSSSLSHLSDGQQFFPIGRIARRKLIAAQLPGAPPPGRGIGDGIAAVAGVEAGDSADDVPKLDADLIRALAERLSKRGSDAARLRAIIAQVVALNT
jgi:hypothetical protein